MMAVGPDFAKLLLDQFVSDVSFYRDVLAAVGLLYVGKSVLNLTWTIYKGLRTHFFSRFCRPSLQEKYGCWAVVTGCTDGIGRAYCIELAKHGFNIAMISRNREKLGEIANYISSTYKVEVVFHTADFSFQPDIYHDIEVFIQSIDPAVLVNNVGMISQRPSFLIEMTDQAVCDHVIVNILPASLMTKLVLPAMIKKRKGAIINISSIATLSPTPLLSVYGATKAYIESFSQAVREEVKGKGITVQTLIPSYVATKMVGYNEHLASSFWTPSPETFVQNAIRTLGRNDYTTGYWLHGLQAWLVSCFPVYFRMKTAYWLNSYFRKQYMASHED